MPQGEIVGSEYANWLNESQASWGDKIITQLAVDLSAEFSDAIGFSRSNLFNIRKFYRFYSTETQLVQHNFGLLEKLSLLPWGHHIQIFSKCKHVNEAIFYIQEAATHSWKRSVLIYKIESGLYFRQGKAHTNFDRVLPKTQSELAQEILKNPYNIGYLGLTNTASEKELENSILSHVKKFLLELGTGFAFYGQQFQLQISDRDYYIDLLFYHTRLHCYFVIELKVTEFEPEQACKLEFYITAIDELLKMPEDKPTIGLLLCKTADKVIVEYTLKTKTKPMGVAEYKHVVPRKWKSELPDEKTLKDALEKNIGGDKNSHSTKAAKVKRVLK